MHVNLQLTPSHFLVVSTTQHSLPDRIAEDPLVVSVKKGQIPPRQMPESSKHYKQLRKAYNDEVKQTAQPNPTQPKPNLPVTMHLHTVAPMPWFATLIPGFQPA